MKTLAPSYHVVWCLFWHMIGPHDELLEIQIGAPVENTIILN